MELYIHIPFCVKKCDYCDFLSFSKNSENREKYVKALIKEIKAVGLNEKREISTIFFGGGTPSLLSGKQISQIMENIYRYFNVNKNAEITMEANPGTLTETNLCLYKKAGINRLSIGLQSANNRELKALGRIHSFEEFLNSYELAKNTGFKNINIDLIYGIPYQDFNSFKETLHKIIDLEPTHISAYSLIVEENTPFFSRKLNLPGEDEILDMTEYLISYLKSNGFNRYEISNYSKEGYECKHNLGYWEREDYIGLGLGSASLVDEVRFNNISDFHEYLKYSNDIKKIRTNYEELTLDDRINECMFLGFRMTKGINKEKFEKKFRCCIEQMFCDKIKKYKDLGLIEENNKYIYLTNKGINVSNVIMEDFYI